jgi:two-component system cell cycle response regulator
LLIAADMQPDCILISLGFADFDALRLCTQLRALDRTRALPIMVVTDEGDGERIARALDIGVNDYVARPCDEQEVVARARTQLRNKRAMERLRHTVLQTAVPTLTDPATGTNSRHFLDNHLPALLERCRARGHALSLIVAELDASHDGNDAVLAEFARRILSAVRPADLVCRFAGTQFAVAMANTDAESAWRIAERIRHAVTEMPFAAGAGSPLAIAVSSGVATADAASTDVSSLVARTLAALEKARNSGRNRVAAEAA